MPKEFRKEAVKLVKEEALSVPDVFWRLDLPESTETGNWLAQGRSSRKACRDRQAVATRIEPSDPEPRPWQQA